MKILRICGVVPALVLGMVLFVGSVTVAQDSDPASIYLAAYDAFGEGDVETGMALVDEDIVAVLLPPPPGVESAQTGKDLFRQLTEELVADNAVWAFDDVDVKGETMTFTVQYSADDDMADLGVYPLELTGFAVVRDGLIVSEVWSMNKDSLAEVDEAMIGMANREAVRRYMEELWSEGDLSVVDEVVAEDFVSHWMPEGQGRDFLKESVADYRAEHPGAYFPIVDLVMTEDRAYVTNRMWVVPEDAPEGDRGEPASPQFLVVLGLEEGMITDRRLYSASE